MLEGIAAGLPAGDRRRPAIAARRCGIASAALRPSRRALRGGHWLGSFATYLATGRGLPRRAPAPR